MKKLIKISALAILAMGLVFNFAACSSGDDDDNNNNNTENSEPNSGSESSGSTTVTATITYDGSSEENAPTGTGSLFTSVQETVSAWVSDTFGGLKEGYPKWATQTYNSGNSTSSGIVVVNATDLSDKVALTEGDVVAYLDYGFTLSSAASVSAEVGAFNSQSSNLCGQVVILDSSNTAVATGEFGEGAKEGMEATLSATSLAAGSYTLRFNWAAKATVEASKGLKKFLGGVTDFTITATSAN